MNKQISFYNLDMVSKIGIVGGWISFTMFMMSLASYIFLKLIWKS